MGGAVSNLTWVRINHAVANGDSLVRKQTNSVSIYLCEYYENYRFVCLYLTNYVDIKVIKVPNLFNNIKKLLKREIKLRKGS